MNSKILKNSKFFNLDIFSKRIGLYYEGKDTISSYFGLVLTSIYIILSIIIFLIYTISTFKRDDMKFYDSTIYPESTPLIHLDKSIFYFTFSIEDPVYSNKFIDETIFYPKAILKRTKRNEKGEREIIEIKQLKLTRCKLNHFDKDFQKFYKDSNLNNSYCIDNYDNLILEGGFKFDTMAYIRIEVYPCMNTTENKNKCKSKEIIKQYLNGGYFQILSQDIGSTPSNFSYPTVPTTKDMYTTIGTNMVTDYIITYKILEIHTSEGLITEDINVKKFLQFDKEQTSFSFRNEEILFQGNYIIALHIRLSDKIQVQQRYFTKISEVCAKTGGYMQLISTIFTLLAILPNKFNFENKLTNKLFKYDEENEKYTMINKKLISRIKIICNKNNKEINNLNIFKEQRISEKISKFFTPKLHNKPCDSIEIKNPSLLQINKINKNKKINDLSESKNNNVGEIKQKESYMSPFINNDNLIISKQNSSFNKSFSSKYDNDLIQNFTFSEEFKNEYKHLNVNMLEFYFPFCFKHKVKTFNILNESILFFKKHAEIIKIIETQICFNKLLNKLQRIT